jgi:hypothetical protein
MLAAAGLLHVKVGVGARKAGDPFTVLIAAGSKGESNNTKTRNATTAKPRSAQEP